MTQKEKEDNLRVFHALDHEVRLRILAYLADHGQSTFDDLYRFFDSTRIHLHHHLKVLIDRNLVDIPVWGMDKESQYKLSEKSLKMLDDYRGSLGKAIKDEM